MNSSGSGSLDRLPCFDVSQIRYLKGQVSIAPPLIRTWAGGLPVGMMNQVKLKLPT